MATTKTTEAESNASPWPDGSDGVTGLYPIVTIGIARSGQAAGQMDYTINTAAIARLSDARLGELVKQIVDAFRTSSTIGDRLRRDERDLGRHTPGPWFVIPGSPGKMHAILSESDLVTVGYVGTKELPNDSNAQLIAAAPDLFVALKAILDDGIGYEGDTESCECGLDGTGIGEDGKPCCHILARRAIAKAEYRDRLI